ncbi:LysE family translocator [Cellulomonas sp. ICMP 17802]|uniref:LysE family translocator n=1 Tax=Cellulomonas sp. ICMP 17802 TaxID=3239199 RepID=UPI00351B3B7E
MDLSAAAAFWVLSLLFVLAPGADWAFAISAGLHGRVIGPAVGGLLAGHLTHTLLVAVGVGALVARAPEVLTALTVAGAAYLVWFGVGTLTRAAAPRADDAAVARSPGQWAARGWGISGLNPKVLLLLVALLPQFTDPGGGWPLPVQIALLGLAHTVSCAVVYTSVALTARHVLRARPTAALVVSRMSGVVMIGLGAVLGVEQLLR